MEILASLVMYRRKKCLMGTFRDITELKLINDELKRTNKELQKLNDEKDKFFSIIAHDLKSPFNSILGFSKLLSDQLKSENFEGIVPYVEAKR